MINNTNTSSPQHVMKKYFALLIITSCCSFHQSLALGCECIEDGATKQDINISVSVTKNTTDDDWVGEFYAEKIVAGSEKGVNLEVKQSIVRCGGSHIVRIKGVIRDLHPVNSVPVPNGDFEKPISNTTTAELKVGNDDKLRFQEKTGKYVVLLNNGRTAYRKDAINNNQYSTLITQRPLKDDELFEVVLEKIINKWHEYVFVFGVTKFPPENIDGIVNLYSYKNETWVLGEKRVRHNGVYVVSNYGIDATKIKVGERVGVKRKGNGDLHFYLNGKDMGRAASNTSGPVYGILDIINYAEQFSIV